MRMLCVALKHMPSKRFSVSILEGSSVFDQERLIYSRMLNAVSLKGETLQEGGLTPRRRRKKYQNQIGRDCQKIAILPFIFMFLCPPSPQGLSARSCVSSLPKSRRFHFHWNLSVGLYALLERNGLQYILHT